MIRNFIFSVALLISIQSFAQVDTSQLKKNAISCADSMQSALKNKDWAAFTSYMHPSLIKEVGGNIKFQEFIKEQMKTLDDYTISRMETGNVLQIVRHNEQWQCVIETYLEIKVDSIVVSAVNSNIGFSDNIGLIWKFIRVPQGKENTFRKAYPTVSSELKIPLNVNKVGITLDDFLKSYKPAYSRIPD